MMMTIIAAGEMRLPALRKRQLLASFGALAFTGRAR